MKILAIHLILCLSLSMYGQTSPETKEDPVAVPATPVSPSALPESPVLPEEPILPGETSEYEGDEDYDEVYDDGFMININLGNDNTNGLRVGMVDLGISTYVDEDGSLDMGDELEYMDQRLARSINVGIHLVNVKKGFRKSDKPQNFGFSVGIKWNIVHYSFERDFTVEKNSDRFQDGLNYDVPELRHNRLKANYLQVPLLLEYNSNPSEPSKSLNIAAGVAFQLLLNSNYKYKTEDGDKTKIKGDYNLTKFATLAEVRFGYGPLNFYVQYGPRLFQVGDGPFLKPINFGLNIIPR